MASQAESKSKQDATKEDKQQKTAQQNGADGQKLDSLLSSLEGDITAIDSDAALGIIDEWYGSLHKAKEPELKEISNSLKELKQLLKGGKATGHEIGEVLTEIGHQTANIASDADKEQKTSLQKLGKQLTKAGTALGRAEDQEHIEHIDSLVEKLEEEDLTAIDSDTATGAIDQWYKLLHKSENENIQEIANGLKELKQLLKRSKAKGTDIGEVLTRIGNQTTEAAKEAPRGMKGHIQKLGKLLSRSGKQLSESPEG